MIYDISKAIPWYMESFQKFQTENFEGPFYVQIDMK